MSASSVALNTVETGPGPLRASDVVVRLKIEPKPGGQSLIRLRAFLNFASKRGIGAGAGVKLAGHDPLFLRLLINRALTKSPTAKMATMQPTISRPEAPPMEQPISTGLSSPRALTNARMIPT